MRGMFLGADGFDQPIGDWDTAKGHTKPQTPKTNWRINPDSKAFGLFVIHRLSVLSSLRAGWRKEESRREGRGEAGELVLEYLI